ncbi:MAG TPA: serine/threonine protein kinase [Caldithrix abyssi]|uniref:non-specific serine/threonine protein kinase n=1 Tax=Caldithrix abyssi TaxID=187145 RepID=A0A7V1PV82_CALAY|nr:serine/threonine protein kinase [Caldithrix abyssi]
MSKNEKNTVISGYRIIEKIGEGGMAEIYTARQAALRRMVVIKKLKDPNREIVARFKKEALLSAGFSQENVLSIYDFIYHGRSYYLVMEYVDGEDLRTLLDRHSPFPIDIAVLIILEIARGLEYTHNQNIIHRDIKPGNILISREGKVKLIDFGVAKDDDDSKLTMTGLIVGTPAYMSPEQAHGDPLTPQSDLYALGILLYEMLTGLKPFYGSNNTEILAKIIKGRYTAAPVLNPEIPRKIQRIIRKSLHRDRRRRYKTATAMIHDLEKTLPWQHRGRKKIILARFLEQLENTPAVTTDETLKMSMAENASGRGWQSWRVLLLLSFILVSFSTLQRFHKTQMGYMRLEHSGVNLEVEVDRRPVTVRHSGALIGPYLKGTHEITARDILSNASYIRRFTLAPADTALIRLQFPGNMQSSSTRFLISAPGAQLYIDDMRIENSSQTLRMAPGWHHIRISRGDRTLIDEQRFFRPAESYTFVYDLSPNR